MGPSMAMAVQVVTRKDGEAVGCMVYKTRIPLALLNLAGIKDARMCELRMFVQPMNTVALRSQNKHG
jgi:hypothetical protein